MSGGPRMAGPPAGMLAKVVVIGAALVVGGCRGGSDNKKSRRTGSAAPVEVVAQPQLPEAGDGPGPTVDEIEPNDGEEVATPISLGGTARGKVEPDADVDYYRLDVDRAGVLQVMVSGVEGQDLTLELVDPTGATLARSERSGVRIREGIPNAGVTPGRYMLIVKLAPKPKTKVTKKPKAKKGAAPEAEPPSPPAPVYELSAQLVQPGPGAEHETNDDRGTANDLIVADNAVGFIGWTDDRDVWKLSVETLSDNNSLDIEISAIEGVALSLEISDGIGQTLATRKAPRGRPLVVRNLVPTIPEGAPPFHYLTVRGDRSNPETTYTMHAKAQLLGPDPEREPNDSLDRAQQVPADRTVVHAAWSPGDVDYFAIAPSESARTLDVAIDTPSEIDLAVDVLVDGKQVATANKGGKGVVEKVSAPVPPGASAVIRVRNPDAAASADVKYGVSIQETTVTSDDAP